MNRIDARLEDLRKGGRIGVAFFVTVGFPEKRATLPIVRALVEGGADFVELGVPFSDPLADGATIQRSSQRALANRVTLAYSIKVCAEAREQFPHIPLVLMGYYNPILKYGIHRFTEEASQAQLDGLIVPDLPPEEAAALRRACISQGIHLVFLLSPTSTNERVRTIGEASSGLLYCVSLTGVTGARQELDQELPQFLERVRKVTPLPLMVGFGISTRRHIEALSGRTEAVVVGSALIDLIERTATKEREKKITSYVRELVGVGN